MTDNKPPVNSMERFGGLEAKVNRLFELRNLPYTFKDNLLPLFNVKGRSLASRAREVGVTPRTFESWETIYKATKK